MLGTIFHITDVCQEDNIWTLKMTLWNYEDHDWNTVSFTIQYDVNDKTNIDPANLLQLCSTLLNFGEVQLAERLIKNYLHELTLANVENKNAVQIGQYYQKLGHCALFRKEYKVAIELFDKALNMFAVVLPQNHLIIATTHLSIGNALSSIQEEEKAYRSYEIAISIYKQYYHEESVEMQVCYANIKAFGVSDRTKSLFCEVVRPKGCFENLDEATKIDNEEDLSQHADVHETWLIPANEYLDSSTGEANSTISQEQNRFMTKNIPPCLLNQSTIRRLVSRLICPIIIYTCPCCKQRVWIYKIFGMFKGSPCFLCVRRTFFFGPGTARK